MQGAAAPRGEFSEGSVGPATRMNQRAALAARRGTGRCGGRRDRDPRTAPGPGGCRSLRAARPWWRPARPRAPAGRGHRRGQAAPAVRRVHDQVVQPQPVAVQHRPAGGQHAAVVAQHLGRTPSESSATRGPTPGLPPSLPPRLRPGVPGQPARGPQRPRQPSRPGSGPRRRGRATTRRRPARRPPRRRARPAPTPAAQRGVEVLDLPRGRLDRDPGVPDREARVGPLARPPHGRGVGAQQPVAQRLGAHPGHRAMGVQLGLRLLTRWRTEGRGGTGLPDTMSRSAMLTGSPTSGATTHRPSPQARQTPSRSVIAGPPDGPVSPRTNRRTTTR